MSGSSIDVFTWRATVREQVVLDPGCLDMPLGEALGRVLARPVTSPEDIPAVPLSAMDGFAVRRSDLTAPGATRLPVVADIPARPGTSPELPLGVAMRIMTGAPAPGGADAEPRVGVFADAVEFAVEGQDQRGVVCNPQDFGSDCHALAPQLLHFLLGRCCP